jgi:2-keto-4-pentenoate hydratase
VAWLANKIAPYGESLQPATWCWPGPSRGRSMPWPATSSIVDYGPLGAVAPAFRFV